MVHIMEMEGRAESQPKMSPLGYQLFGWTYLLLSAISVGMHLICGYAILRLPTFRQRISLRIILSMGICDSIQLIIHAFSGLVIIVDFEVPKVLNSALGLAIDTAWQTVLFLQVSLALNRFYIVTRTNISRENDFQYFDLPVLISWTVSLLYSYAYWTGGRDVHFERDILGWSTYGVYTWLVVTLYQGELLVTVLGLILSTLTVISMAIRRYQQSQDRRMIRSLEIRLFAQTSVIHVLAFSNILLWNLLEAEPVEIQALLNVEWILICALPPYLNILMSNEIRRSVMEIFGWNSAHKKTNIQVTTVRTWNTTKRQGDATSSWGDATTAIPAATESRAETSTASPKLFRVFTIRLIRNRDNPNGGLLFQTRRVVED